MNARQWLRANNYNDIADLIDELINRWQAEGKKTRRNWWDILSGKKNGIPCKRGGIEFPIIRAAQLRQGKPVTKNAICRNQREEPPPINKNNRWSNKNN